MKTTVHIPDGLLEEARRIARRDQTTLKDLVESGLRREIAERRGTSEFKLLDGSVGGRGLQPHLKGATWEEIRALAYEGRGG